MATFSVPPTLSSHIQRLLEPLLFAAYLLHPFCVYQAHLLTARVIDADLQCYYEHRGRLPCLMAAPARLGTSAAQRGTRESHTHQALPNQHSRGEVEIACRKVTSTISAVTVLDGLYRQPLLNDSIGTVDLRTGRKSWQRPSWTETNTDTDTSCNLEHGRRTGRPGAKRHN